jgi:(Z)-2-((N-methylformamido)methylene)-5-hydroxybutyrolactone dehydrogenase
MKKYRMLIDGAWVDAASGEWFESINPFTAQPWALIPRGARIDVDRAAGAAKKAFYGKDWRGLTASARGALLRRLGDLLAAEADKLAEIETTDNGKLLSEMRVQLQYAPKWFHYFAGLADKIEGRVIPSDKGAFFNFTREEPLGVVAAITPWNFPNAMIARKAGPALAAGCAFVCKPATETPLSALALAELADRAGIPAGVFSVITGSAREIGTEMTANPIVRGLTFTGSTEVGRLLMAQCAPSIKKLGLELGGNAPFIVFDDADLDAAVRGAMA